MHLGCASKYSDYLMAALCAFKSTLITPRSSGTMRASHINELHFGQAGRSIGGDADTAVLDKGMARSLIPTLTRTI